MRHWNWDGMVEGNREWLFRLLAGLFVMLGSADVLPRRVKREMLARLIPLESALRRLIAVMARDIPVVAGPARAAVTGSIPKGSGPHKPVFRLIDPIRDPDPKTRSVPRKKEPRIRSLDDWTPREMVPDPTDDDLMDATALRRRMEAMRDALGDLPGQARRLARWYARGERMRQRGTWWRLYSIRAGRPPGFRKQGKREVDRVLACCHDLAVRCRAMVEAERYAR